MLRLQPVTEIPADPTFNLSPILSSVCSADILSSVCEVNACFSPHEDVRDFIFVSHSAEVRGSQTILLSCRRKESRQLFNSSLQVTVKKNQTTKATFLCGDTMGFCFVCDGFLIANMRTN